jgi:hypothetical protein
MRILMAVFFSVSLLIIWYKDYYRMIGIYYMLLYTYYLFFFVLLFRSANRQVKSRS